MNLRQSARTFYLPKIYKEVVDQLGQFVVIFLERCFIKRRGMTGRLRLSALKMPDMAEAWPQNGHPPYNRCEKRFRALLCWQ